ncbi:uncharacterized protein LOC134718055 [Mytilus trossulus]|uniref:uncharacterized protein LOC134718055 n=1 Tax=Mytilus trossulus TaxID=6551 RepID=UPI003007D100
MEKAAYVGAVLDTPGWTLRSHTNYRIKKNRNRRGKKVQSSEICCDEESRLADPALQVEHFENTEISFSEQAEDIERIPDAIPKPLFTAVSSLDNPIFVIIDLETTDLSKYFSETKIEKRIILKIITCRGNIIPHIVQIAAKEHRTQTSFNPVYNCNMYDIFSQIVMGFIDSLALFRSNFPKIEKYNQPFLAQHFCKEEYNAHNAVDDVNMLDKILIAGNVSKELLLKRCYISNSHLLQENFIKAKAQNLPSFHPLTS